MDETQDKGVTSDGQEPASGTFKLSYYQQFDSLTAGADSGTNALLTAHPGLFLHGALIEAFGFARNAERATSAFARYASLANGLRRSTTRAARSGQSLYPIMTGIA